MYRALGVAASAVLCLLLAACGADDTVEESKAKPLHAQIERARAALMQGDETAASTALADFSKGVQRLRSAGDLNPDDARVLLARADDIAAGIDRQAAAAAEQAAAAERAKETAEPSSDEPVVVDDPPGKGKKGKKNGKGAR